MLRVTIELVPHGDESRSRVIGIGQIANDGTGNMQIGNYGNYEVVLFKSPEYSKSPGTWKKGQVKQFDRKRLGPWDLLFRALAATVGNRNER